MPRESIPRFPLEASNKPWPTLQPTLVERQYQPRQQTPQQSAAHTRSTDRSLLYLDLRDAVGKGAILGLSAFSIFFGIFASLPFWLTGWHWLIALGAAVVLLILIGRDWTLLIVLTTTFILSTLKILSSPILLLWLALFLVAGGVMRGGYELLP